MTVAENTQIQVQNNFQRLFRDGEIVFDEGDEGLALYIILSGQIQISRQGAQGQRVIAKLGTGEFFGEMSVILGEQRTARATVMGDAELLELDGETLEAMCIERPEIGIRLIQRLATRLISAERRLSAMGLDELVGPLVRFIAKQSEQAAPDEELRFATSLRALSDGCELSLQETHQALHQLVDQKLVRIIGTELIAPDPAALSTAATKFAQAS